MAEYIEREEINKAMKEVCDDPSCPMHVAAEIAQIIDCAPTADVVPVVHGRWDDSGRYTFPSGATAVRCTNCGCALTESEYRLNNWNYCPVCGAKMDGGADND